ncbi:MAG TPA: sulfate adenylyltransferase [Polyangiaceae bacterium]|jgi:sulfate adenylyltransferase/3'-phosphoadenosine 5'-phosphosulfate synthase
MSNGFVVWFTGLSGSGKSTLATMLQAEIRGRGVPVEVLDGDEVRTHLSKGLGFSKEDRDTNIRRIGYVAKLLSRSGACAMTAAISPYRAIRDEQRAQVGRFVEVYCRCDIPTLTARDAKGLYKKALAGEIKGFTGIDDPYEAPEKPEVVVDTATESKEESLGKIVAKLAELGYLAAHASSVTAGGASTPAGDGLIAPHGGELVNRLVKGADHAKLAERARSLPAVDLDDRAASDVEMIAVGAFSPLAGFMNQKDYLRVVADMRLERGLPWSMPVTLAVSEEQAQTLAIGSQVALRAQGGRVVAVLDLDDKFRPDKSREAERVYGTTETKHPGVAYLMAAGPVCLGGQVHVLERGTTAFPDHHRDPAQTRALFAERKWTRVVGFQTRNPIHRAHEYITKCALEICDGLLIHPLVGATKGDDIPADVRMRCYEALLARYYVKERVLLSIYPAAMRYAGPREALFHAIARKNYGCSHFIVGRDHAGVGSYYGTYDAQRIFRSFAPGELGIQPLCFENAFYSKAAGSMGTDKTAPGDESTKVSLSGTKVREMLSRGELPPPEFSRPEVAAILIESMRKGA